MEWLSSSTCKGEIGPLMLGLNKTILFFLHYHGSFHYSVLEMDC